MEGESGKLGFPGKQTRNPLQKGLAKRHFVCRACVRACEHACRGRGHPQVMFLRCWSLPPIVFKIGSFTSLEPSKKARLIGW